jgi:hypothetical protein
MVISIRVNRGIGVSFRKIGASALGYFREKPKRTRAHFIILSKWVSIVVLYHLFLICRLDNWGLLLMC